MFVDYSHLLDDSLHDRANIPWLYRVEPVSSLNALTDHLQSERERMAQIMIVIIMALQILHSFTSTCEITWP